MRRIYVFGAAVVGIAAGAFFLSQGGYIDLGTFWQTVLSYFRRVTDKVTAATSNDPYDKALDMIAGFEGFSAKAYPDADGYSIGNGHFIRPEDPYDSSSVITEAEARTLLEQDVRTAQVCVLNAVTVPLNENQMAALISLTFNIGCGAFRGSTLLKLLNQGDYAGAANQFPRWNKSNGLPIQALIDRRAEEMGVFVA